MSRTDTWMPLYVADYIADTRRLSLVEHGAYLLLLMEYWRHGPLPDNDKELAAIVHADRRHWDKDIGPSVRRFFQRHDDGLLHQKRIDLERSKSVQLSNKRRDAVAQRRDRMPSNADQTTNKEPTIVEQLNTHAGACPIARQSQSQKERTDLRSDAGAPPPLDARTILWSSGLELLARLTGKPPKACRTLLGKWAKETRDDCAMLSAILSDCAEVRPGDPVAWITQGVAARMKPPDRFSWLDEPIATPVPEFDLEASVDEHGTFHSR